MKTKIEKLQELITLSKGNLKTSLQELLTQLITRTGRSGYSKGWANKSVWTIDVTSTLRSAHIKCERGNDAPRGGANGEFVKVTDKVLLKQIKSRNAELQKAAELAKIEAENAKAKAYSEALKYVETLPSTELLEVKWNSLELKVASGLSWSSFRDSLKIQHPEQWLILKAKFRAKQSLY